MRYGDEGEEIKALQRALIGLGYDLPKFGADGDLGGETWRALEAFAWNEGIDPDGIEGLDEDSDVSEIADVVSEHFRSRNTLIETDSDGFTDVTERNPGTLSKGARSRVDIDAIVLHQTGTGKLPNDPMRWLHVPIHIGIPRTEGPEVYVLNRLTAYLWHANGFNRRSVGIEVCGNFEGLEGDKRTWWAKGGGPNQLLGSQIEATRRAIRYLCERLPITHIFAHRQSSGQRIADPGESVWEECGEWAKRTLGLSDGGPGYFEGKGRPIPYEWAKDPTYAGFTYW